MFSPMVRIFSFSRASTVSSEPEALQASRASTSAGFCSMTVSAQVLTKAWKSAFLATKSVSALTSITTPTLPFSLTVAKATPSAAIRPAFFTEAARPFSRRKSMAFSISPSEAVRAFLQSIMPQPVFSRRAATSLAVKFICKHPFSSHPGGTPRQGTFPIGYSYSTTIR